MALLQEVLANLCQNDPQQKRASGTFCKVSSLKP